LSGCPANRALGFSAKPLIFKRKVAIISGDAQNLLKRKPPPKGIIQQHFASLVAGWTS
jgi:hypothetical protein